MGKEKLVYDGFSKVYEKEIEIKGEKRIYERIDIKSGVAGILIDEDGKIALVSQYRPIIDEQTLEIPAGMIDKEISNIEILKEEFAEECGIENTDIIELSSKPVFSYYMLIGSSNCKLEIYKGRVTKQESKEIDDVDVDRVEWLTYKEFEELVKKGKIKDAKTLLAFNYMKSAKDFNETT